MTESYVSSPALPAQFADLESYIAGWARPIERERRHLCATKKMADIEEYYQRFGPRLTEIAGYLDTFPMGSLPPPERNLMMLAQMYMEVAVCVEFLKAPEMGPIQIPQDRWHILDVERAIV